MTQENLIFLPFWVETALKRNSLTMDACLDYSQIRQILSLEDMSGLLAIQELKAVTRDESVFSRTLLNCWNESAKGPQRVELDSTIVPLSRSNELKEELLLRLSNDSKQNDTFPQNDVVTTFYKIVDIGRGRAAMVVYKGFPEFACKPENEYNIVVEQLKIFYVYLKSYQVSLLPIFRKYVYLLSLRLVSKQVV